MENLMPSGKPSKGKCAYCGNEIAKNEGVGGLCAMNMRGIILTTIMVSRYR